MKRLLFGISLAAVLTFALALSNFVVRTSAIHQPADKVAASASTLQVMQVQLVEGMSSLPVSLLSGTLRASSPTDLILQVSAECALWTDVAVVGNGTSEAIATVEVWIEIDGVAVPVTSDPAAGGPDNGKVTFANREFRLTTLNLDEDDEIQLYLRTKAAHAFDWVRLNLGSGIHVIEVKAQLTAQVTGMGTAKALVEKRTLVAEPAKLANDATI